MAAELCQSDRDFLYLRNEQAHSTLLWCFILKRRQCGIGNKRKIATVTKEQHSQLCFVHKLRAHIINEPQLLDQLFIR